MTTPPRPPSMADQGVLPDTPDTPDAHLLAALRQAPDAQLEASADMGEALRFAARAAIAASAGAASTRATAAVPSRRWAWLDRWLQPGPAAGLAFVVLASVVVVLWRGEEVPTAARPEPVVAGAQPTPMAAASQALPPVPAKAEIPPQIALQPPVDDAAQPSPAVVANAAALRRRQADRPAPAADADLRAPAATAAPAAPAEQAARTAAADLPPPAPAIAAAPVPAPMAEAEQMPAASPAAAPAPPAPAAAPLARTAPATAALQERKSAIADTTNLRAATGAAPARRASGPPMADLIAAITARARETATGSLAAAGAPVWRWTPPSQNGASAPADEAAAAWLARLRGAAEGRWRSADGSAPMAADATRGLTQVVFFRGGEMPVRVILSGTTVEWRDANGAWRAELPDDAAASLRR